MKTKVFLVLACFGLLTISSFASDLYPDRYEENKKRELLEPCLAEFSTAWETVTSVGTHSTSDFPFLAGYPNRAEYIDEFGPYAYFLFVAKISGALLAECVQKTQCPAEASVPQKKDSSSYVDHPYSGEGCIK